MRSATFRNIALGILALAAAYHLGARSATAQAGTKGVSGFAVSAWSDRYGLYMVTPNGDVYVRRLDALAPTPKLDPPVLVCHYWSGGLLPESGDAAPAKK